jgi:hypothetical protein
VFTRHLSLGLLSLALAAFSPAASAQTWSPEQQELWRLEELQWKLAAAKDASWIEKMVHPNLSYWDKNWPGPLQQRERHGPPAGTLPDLDQHHRQRGGHPLPLFGRAGELQEGTGNGDRSVHGRAGQGWRTMAVHHLGRRGRPEEVARK